MSPITLKLCENLLEAYLRYREHARRPVSRRPSPEERELAFAETTLLTEQLTSALSLLLRQDGAVTPHGLVSRQIAPVVDLVLPPGEGRWRKV